MKFLEDRLQQLIGALAIEFQMCAAEQLNFVARTSRPFRSAMVLADRIRAAAEFLSEYYSSEVSECDPDYVEVGMVFAPVSRCSR